MTRLKRRLIGNKLKCIPIESTYLSSILNKYNQIQNHGKV